MLKPLGDRVVLKVEEKEQKVGGFVIAGAGQDATKEVKDQDEKFLVVGEASMLAIVE